MADKSLNRHGRIEKHLEKYREIIANLTIMNDIFMRNVFKKRECLEYVLQIVMSEKQLHVIDFVIQKDYKNLQGRSAILDCVAEDIKGRRFNVEIQQDGEGATPKRARYHSALLDMNTINPGQDFNELPESYVIFITKNDPLGENRPIYHIKRVIEENNRGFQDGSYIIFVNSKIQDDSALGKLMHDLHCKNASDMYSDVLAQRVRELKEGEGGKTMCKELQELIDEVTDEASRKAELNKAKEVTISLAKMGLELNEIAKAVHVEQQQVQRWIKEATE